MPPSCALLGGFAIGERDALLWQHYGNAWQSPAVIRQAQRTPHALRTHAPAIKSMRLLLYDVICNEAVLFRPYCARVATRTRNVSEYMLVLALCLVYFCDQFIVSEIRHSRRHGSVCQQGQDFDKKFVFEWIHSEEVDRRIS